MRGSPTLVSDEPSELVTLAQVAVVQGLVDEGVVRVPLRDSVMMDPRPLSSRETYLVSTFAESLVESLRKLDNQDGSAHGLDDSGWLSVDGAGRALVTDLVPHWGGIGRREPVFTIGDGYGTCTLAYMSTTPGGASSSLLVLDPIRGPMVVRFLPYRKNNALRFMVGEPGHRASVWRVWTGSSADDVYLGDRQSIRFAKFSLHQSGDWRLQYTSQDRHEVQVHNPAYDAKDRVIHQWSEPRTRADGWVHAASISTARRDVVDVPRDLQQIDDTILVPTPEPGWSAEFMFFLVTPDLAVINLGSLLTESGSKVALLGGYLLPSGKTLVVVVRTVPLPADAERALTQARRDAIRRHLNTGWSLDPASAPRILIHPQDDTGPVMMWDVALAKTWTFGRS